MDQTEKIEKMKTYIAKQRLLNVDTLEFALYRKSGKIIKRRKSGFAYILS